jgi:hypothetical protein
VKSFKSQSQINICNYFEGRKLEEMKFIAFWEFKPKDKRYFFTQEIGKAFVPDRYKDVFQGRAPKNVLAKQYNPLGIRMLKEIYEKANLKVIG